MHVVHRDLKPENLLLDRARHERAVVTRGARSDPVAPAALARQRADFKRVSEIVEGMFNTLPEETTLIL